MTAGGAQDGHSTDTVGPWMPPVWSGPRVVAEMRVEAFLDAGFTDVARVQIGDESQQDFLRFALTELLPALRAQAN